ncbi:MAG: PDZ domain-containing protein [Planctomycetaceae bacterium]
MTTRVRIHIAAVAAVLAFVASSRCIWAAPPLAELEEQAFKQAAAIASPSLVRIQTVGGVDRVGEVLTVTGPTTGVIVSEEGHIVSSAFNFISKPTSILVELADGRRFPAVNIATDHSKMLTLLKIEESGLTPAVAAPKKENRVGQWSIALGRTYETAEPSISVGIISALNRVWGKAIQTDAKVSPLNYGGPLVDIEGKVLGVLVPLSPQENEATAGIEWYDSGIGFAIPMEDVYAAVERLKSGNDLKPGLMGINFKSGSLSAEASIDRVRVDSPAEKAGLKPGDIIVEVEGKAVRRHDEVKFALGGKYAGDDIALVVSRDNKRVSATLKLVSELKPYEAGYLGILPMREPRELADKGVGVRFVYPESPAAKAGIAARDRILKVNGADATNAVALFDLVSRQRPSGTLKVTIRHESEERTVDVTLAAVPDEILPELRSVAIPAGEVAADDQKAGADAKPNDESDKRKTGRFMADMPGREQAYWAYVPEDYNPKYAYGLIVWLQPSSDGMEQSVLKKWKPICDTRGLLLLAPKPSEAAGWNPGDAGFIKEAVMHFASRYNVDPARVVAHGYESGGAFAYVVAFRHRETFRGLCVAGAPLSMPPPENHPDYRLQIHLLGRKADPAFARIEASAKILRAMKFPTTIATDSDGNDEQRRYPSDEQVEEIGRWADALDRI